MIDLAYIILCHLFGDYVLQTDYLAANKGKDWYILFVHSALYCIPFIVVFGMDSRAYFMFITHFTIDALKARWNEFGIFTDQAWHYAFAIIAYL